MDGKTGPTGRDGLTSVSPFSFLSDPFAATIATNSLTLYSADILNPGAVNVTGQAFAGIKTFIDGIRLDNLNPMSSGFYNNPTFFEARQSILGDLPILDYSGGAALQQGSWGLQKVGRYVMAGFADSGAVVLSAPGVNITSPAGSVPAPFVPIAVPRTCPCIVLNNGIKVGGFVTVNINGSLLWATTAAGAGFTGVAGILDCNILYNN
jgi:hypothetical protein